MPMPLDLLKSWLYLPFPPLSRICGGAGLFRWCPTTLPPRSFSVRRKRNAPGRQDEQGIYHLREGWTHLHAWHVTMGMCIKPYRSTTEYIHSFSLWTCASGWMRGRHSGRPHHFQFRFRGFVLSMWPPFPFVETERTCPCAFEYFVHK